MGLISAAAASAHKNVYACVSARVCVAEMSAGVSSQRLSHSLCFWLIRVNNIPNERREEDRKRKEETTDLLVGGGRIWAASFVAITSPNLIAAHSLSRHNLSTLAQNTRMRVVCRAPPTLSLFRSALGLLLIHLGSICALAVGGVIPFISVVLRRAHVCARLLSLLLLLARRSISAHSFRQSYICARVCARIVTWSAYGSHPTAAHLQLICAPLDEAPLTYALSEGGRHAPILRSALL